MRRLGPNPSPTAAVHRRTPGREALSAQGVPLLFTSIYPPSRELMAFEPVAWLVKPFTLSRLGRAIEAATIAGGCARRSSCSR